MTTQIAKRTINISGKTIIVKLERGTWDEEIRLDGQLTSIKTHLVDRLDIALYDGTNRLAHGNALNPLPARHSSLAQAVKNGCVGLIGNNFFVRAETADAIKTAIAEVEAENPKTPEMIVLEQAEIELKQSRDREMEQYEADQRERESHPGWCKRCQDWTWGDCGHN